MNLGHENGEEVESHMLLHVYIGRNAWLGRDLVAG